MSVEALKAKVTALEELLHVLEETTIDQSRRLDDARRENESNAAQMLASERERSRLALERAVAMQRAQAMENEFAIARQIQTSILPRTLAIEGLELTAQMVPAEEVGGDYYDVIPTREGCWLGIGDVAGHGLNAGLIMMMTQGIAAAVASVIPSVSPADVLVALNAVLYENIRRRLLRDDHVTLTLLRYSRDGGVVFAGAHEPIDAAADRVEAGEELREAENRSQGSLRAPSSRTAAGARSRLCFSSDCLGSEGEDAGDGFSARARARRPAKRAFDLRAARIERDGDGPFDRGFIERGDRDRPARGSLVGVRERALVLADIVDVPVDDGALRRCAASADHRVEDDRERAGLHRHPREG